MFQIMKSIDEIYNLLLFVCCTVSQIYMVFLHPQKVQEILQAISTTENAPYKNISPKSLFWIAFCVISIEAIAVLTADTILWTDMVGFKLYQFYILRNVQYYQTDMMLLLEMWLCIEQKCRFKHLNVQLDDILKKFNVDAKKASKGLNSFQIEIEVRRIKKCHNRLCNITETFCEVFGTLIVLQVIFHICIVISYTLNIMHYLLIASGYAVWFDDRIAIGSALFLFNNTVSIGTIL
ncbi:unnamed protein product [Acanthoscelides obtectus]|uniref:Uncharacterized protein n=1 Tax=Acanthoscelides obtectus TaxID=200917 RepID=A0A9P0PYV8_ACAOB|nr:unnamed protein product [Acanthoscelides obtectus]CAK1645911.1 hypothetical protein AOBTE_LOCUS14335 [Acanthoscelides obtectus]